MDERGPIERCDFPGCDFVGSWSAYLEHVVAHPLPHPDDRPRWLRARRTLVGASEVPAVCGLNPYKGSLSVYVDKIAPPAPSESSVASRLGLLFEGPLLQDYADRHRVRIRRPATARHRSAPWLAASPDGDSDRGELVQVKMVGAWMADDWSNGPPDYVRAQVQTEMEVWDRPRCVVLAVLGGTDLQEYPVDRDRDVGRFVVEIVSKFWRDHVVPRVLPEDYEAARGADEELRRLYPRALRPLSMATRDERTLALEYKAVQERASSAEAEKKKLAEELQALIGDREGFTWPRAGEVKQGYATWKAPTGSAPWKAIAEALGERFATPEEVEEVVREFTPELGSRRLLVNVKGK